jgi:subtilisin family serine protease
MKGRLSWASILRRCAVWLFALSGVAATLAAQAGQTPEAATQRQILLMLRLAPAHYRPDAYADDYASAPGRVARRHIASGLAHAHGLVLRDEWPMPAIGVDCFVLEAPDPVAARREAKALSADPRVESAQAMQLFRVLGARVIQNGGDPLYPTQPATIGWHLSELHRQATGKDVRVAVIDSGIAIDHPDLRGQVEVSRNFVDQRGEVGEAHGTAVAGIIAARENNGVGIVGIAPQARLLALRACWQTGASAAACSTFTLARALQFAIDADAQVLNLSLSGPPDRLLARLLDVALARGISVVGAVDAQARDGGFPASHRGVIAVAGLEPDPVTATRAAVTVRVPGDGIPAPLPGDGWGWVSGVSFATAQVSGLVALLRQGHPALRQAELVTLLAPTGRLPLAMERPRAIDACAVMLRSVGHCVCGCAATPAVR